jgi:putative cardiolipin synthase
MGLPRIFLLTATVAILCSCAQLPKDFEVVQSTAITGTEDTALGLRSIADRQSLLDESRVIPLTDGVDAFYVRAALINAAERSLDLQYFLWHKDLTGQVLLHTVLAAADRGVRVRMLLDDLDNQALDSEFYALDTHPNISIRLFNPFATRGFKYLDFITDTARVNRRMHNKSFTADNQYTIVGGRNIGDEYFDAQPDTNFYDFDVLVTGPVVEDVSTQFDIYWNHETAVPVYAFKQNTANAEDLKRVRARLSEHMEAAMDSRYADDVRSSKITNALVGEGIEAYVGEADVVWDDPGKGLGKPIDEIATMKDLMGPYFQSANEEIIMISPYYVPGDRGVATTVDRVKQGISVAVLTNSYTSTDSGVVHAGYSRYREPLLAGGVLIYELKPDSRLERRAGKVAYKSAASLHTKVFILDRKTVFIGSLNLDPRSIDINTEMGIVFHSPEMAADLAKALDETGLGHVYELRLVRSPAESKGEFTTYTWSIEWLEQIDGETTRHTSEPGVGAWESIKLFFSGLAPESLI